MGYVIAPAVSSCQEWLASKYSQQEQYAEGVGRVIDCCSCRVDESQLTGESDDVVKEPPSAAAAAAAANGSNGGSSGSNRVASCLCMSGSKVLEGFGRMLVLAVGPNSQQVRGCLIDACWSANSELKTKQHAMCTLVAMFQ
jgi:hypothetical protein